MPGGESALALRPLCMRVSSTCARGLTSHKSTTADALGFLTLASPAVGVFIWPRLRRPARSWCRTLSGSFSENTAPLFRGITAVVSASLVVCLLSVLTFQASCLTLRSGRGRCVLLMFVACRDPPFPNRRTYGGARSPSPEKSQSRNRNGDEFIPDFARTLFGQGRRRFSRASPRFCVFSSTGSSVPTWDSPMISGIPGIARTSHSAAYSRASCPRSHVLTHLVAPRPSTAT